MRLILPLLIITIAASSINAGMGTRLEWWTIYRKNLMESKHHLLNSAGVMPAQVEIIDRDINRADTAISLLSTQGQNNEDIHLSKQEISKKIDDRILPLFSAASLNIMYHGIMGNQNLPVVKNSMRKLLAMEYSDSQHLSSEDIEYILDHHITPAQWKALATELMAGSLILSHETALKETRSQAMLALTTLHQDHREKHRTLHTDRVTSELLNQTSSINMLSRLGNYTSALEQSVAWNRIKSNLDRTLDHYKKVRNMKQVSLITYLKNKGSLYMLDSELFRSRRKNIEAIKSPKWTADKDNGTSPLLSVPRPVNITRVLEHLDEIRKKHLRVLHLGGKASSLEARRQMDRVIDDAFTTTGKEFSQVKNRVLATDARFINQEYFDRSFLYHNNMKSEVMAYASRSARAIEYQQQQGDRTSRDIINLNRLALERSREYLAFIHRLYEQSAPCASMDIPLVHRDYHATIRHMGKVIDLLSHSMALTRQERKYMTRESMLEYTELKRNLAHQSSNLKIAVVNFQKEYLARYRKTASSGKKEDRTMTTALVNRELELLLESAQDYTRLYQSCTYDRELLTDYVVLYNRLISQAREGTVTPELKKAMDHQSLLPLVSNYTDKKLRGELKLRNIARQEALTGIERMIYLSKFYKRNGIKVDWALVKDDVRRITKTFAPLPSVRIDSWRTTANNITKIDKKIAEKIRLTLYRGIRQRNLASGTPAPGDANQVIKNGKETLTFSLPAGWKKISDTTGTVTGARTVTYTSLEGKLTIQVHILSDDHGNLKSITHQWFKRNRVQPVSTRWGKKGDRNYFWALARSREKKVQVSYTLEQGSDRIIIQGTAGKRSYPVMKKYMVDLVKSLDL